MSNVLIDRQKIDILANAISDKSGVPVTMTLDEMVEAVDSIETGGGEPNLQAKTYTVDSAGTETITADSGYDGLSEVEVTVPQGSVTGLSSIYTTSSYSTGKYNNKLRIGTSNVPTTPIVEAGYVTGTTSSKREVTINTAIPYNPTPTVSGDTVTIPNGYYSSQSTKSVASGIEGTPTATKGTVSNHQVSVTPSVTNTEGYISGGTHTGTAVTVSASELVSGTLTVSTSGTHDVTNYANISVADGSLAQLSIIGNTPTITIDSNGLITASVETKSGNIECVASTRGGFINGGSTTPYYIWGTSATQQLTTRTSSDLTASGATVTVPSGYYSSNASKAVPNATIDDSGVIWDFKTVNNQRVCEIKAGFVFNGGYIDGLVETSGEIFSAIPSNTTITPSTSSQTIGGENYMMESAVTVLAMPSGTAGTPTATKGTVSNHQVSVTPSVTNTTGYITGSTKTGTAVTVSASELVSGDLSITQNGNNIDCANYSTVSVNVSGGGGSSMQIDTIGPPSSITSSTLTFTGLSGEPTSFLIYADQDISPTTTPRVAAIVFDGSSLHGQIVTNTSNAQASYNTNFTKSYSNGTLTITSTNATFITVEHYLIYTYGGGAVDTKDVQVGSGATSITFTGLEAEPELWSCIFKSNFSTSSGYQRVMAVGKMPNGSIVGFAMDSQANPSISYWSSSYSNGSFTITSQGTNAGGYFHQPGYYQLTYAYDDGSSGNYQSKTVTPTTSQQVVEADSGYDALKRVTVNAMPSGSATAPASISGTAASVSTGTNTLTLTKTVSVTPTVTAGYVSSGTVGNSSVSLTASVTTKAAATITPTTTNQTIAAGTYLTGTQTIAGDADLVGGNILSTANIFGVQGTVVVQNYYTGSSAPSSSTGSNGDLYLQS